jgi:hypothetical protein
VHAAPHHATIDIDDGERHRIIERSRAGEERTAYRPGGELTFGKQGDLRLDDRLSRAARDIQRIGEARITREFRGGQRAGVFGARGIVLSGSHASTYEAEELRAPQAVWDSGVPVLGICYG